MTFKSALLFGTALVALSGCTYLADSQKPEFDLPSLWPKTETIDTNKDAAQQARLLNWWSNYNDPVLSKLLDEGLKNNSDLAIAAARVAQARARLDFADANQFPELDGQASAARTSSPANVAKNPVNSFQLAAVLNYELDLWGRLANADASARAVLLSNEANREAVRITVLSEIAQGYFNLRALDENLAVTQNTITSRKEAFDYEQKQYKAGASDGLTFRQAESELAAAQAVLPQLRQQRDEQLSALSVLLGRSPAELIAGNVDRGLDIRRIPAPPFMPADLPSTVLQRRPDIKAAEQQLVAANYDIGVARAAYFPTLSLSALLGLQTTDIGSMFNSAARSWQLGGTLLGPIFDAGRTNANVGLAQGVRDEQTENYKFAVRSAFKDAYDALKAQDNTAEQEKAFGVQVKSLSEALRLASLRYKAGYSNHLEVLDSERGLYSAQISLIESKLARLNASVNLYKAFGGGWNDDAKTNAAPAPVATTTPAPAAPAPAPVKTLPWAAKPVI